MSQGTRRFGRGRASNGIQTGCKETDSEVLLRRRNKFSESNKPVLEYGLVSRGEDDRLQRDANARIELFKQVQHEVSFNAAKLGAKELELLFNSKVPDVSNQDRAKFKDLDHALMSLRKLREALLKFPIDEFSKDVFLFSIRISSIMGSYQTFIPSIRFLLDNSQAGVLQTIETEYIANIYALHLTHFSGNHSLALQIANKYCSKNDRVFAILKSFRCCNYLEWFRYYGKEPDPSKKMIMKFGEDKMLRYTAKVIHKTYFQLPKRYLEEVFRMDYDTLRDKCGAAWDDQTRPGVVIVRSR